MLTLWDLIDPLLNTLAGRAPSKPGGPRPSPRERAAVESGGVRRQQRAQAVAEARSRTRKPSRDRDDVGMQAKYDAVVREMLDKYGVRVRKWRKSMSGIAWYVTYRDGSVQRLIEAPRPKGPMSAAIFLHEIGHHAIGFDVYKPRCLEEYHAWRWSLEAMEAHGLNVSESVRMRMHRSLHYAVAKAKRRGIKRIPEELTPFLEKPPPRSSRNASRR